MLTAEGPVPRQDLSSAHSLAGCLFYMRDAVSRLPTTALPGAVSFMHAIILEECRAAPHAT